MIRVVFDTNVLYSAILKSSGPPATVFGLVTTGLLTPCVSSAVLAEYREVLLERSAFWPYAQRAMLVLDILADVAIRVTPARTLKISDHEDDNRIYECADAAEADYIITGNLKHFPKPHKNTKIITARQMLELLKAAPSEN